MSSSYTGVNPLSYLGVRPNNPSPLYFDDRPPTSADVKNFQLGTIWVDKDGEDAYILVSVATGVATWVTVGGNPGDLQSITTPDASVVTPTAGNVNFLNGSGISMTGSGSNLTVAATATPFLITWSVQTGATQALSVNEGFVSNAGGGVTYTLPATAALGDVIFVSSVNAGGWTIAQNAGQTIQMGNQATTTGAGGSLASNAVGDSLYLVCWTANTDFLVFNSMGNITVT